jgi:repressor LexA
VKQSGRDQKEIADVVGVAPSTFNEWVKAKKYPRIDKIEILANYFGILKSDLIEEHKKHPPTACPELTDRERSLLDLFKKVPKDKQQLVFQMIEVALKTN